MTLDGAAIARGCGGRVALAGDQLCGIERERVAAVLHEAAAVTIGCTAMEPLFRDLAEEVGYEGELAFADLRESAGWSDMGPLAGPKMAGLLAAAGETLPQTPVVSMESQGVALVLGRDEVAIEAGKALAEALDVTVLLERPQDVAPPRALEFPIMRGTVRLARGHLGAFELTVDEVAAPLPSSRTRLVFGPGRDGATSRADIIIDLRGGTPLFPAHEVRDGYLRADPERDGEVAQAIRQAEGLVGTFDKPRYVDFQANLCAHSRSQITGCTRCLEVCPTGAISPAGDHVSIDPHVCAGCGSCASVCPTGAASYSLPPVDALLRRLRALITGYRDAGGVDPVILVHDAEHGAELIQALARYGSGLPANVLPIAVNEVTQLGLEAFLAPFAWGATAFCIAARGRSKHPLTGIERNTVTANLLAESLGYGSGRVQIIETDDPDALGTALRALDPGRGAARPSAFMPAGGKRGVLEQAVREFHIAAPAPVDRVALPAGAPIGGLTVNVEGCTLCLSCVSACPTTALSDNPDKPSLRFTESLCVQCGLCAATCPEDVITLDPRLDFPAWSEPRRVIKEEEPFCCISCGKAFGTKSTIERIIAKLEGKHWMYAGGNARRLDVIRMCDDCRVQAVTNESLDPYGVPERPRPRTSDDYLRDGDVS